MTKSHASTFFVSLGTILPQTLASPMRKIAERTDLGFWYQQFGKARITPDRFDLLEIGSTLLEFNFVYLEFGVAWGDSMRRMVEITVESNQVELHGFDTFDGLHEPHHGHITQGSFTQNGNVPDVPGVVFHKGFFAETFSGTESYLQKSLFVMCDADLYSSTSYILRTIRTSLKFGDLLYFDDLHIPNQERLALDLEIRKGLKLRLIARSSEGRSALFKVLT